MTGHLGNKYPIVLDNNLVWDCPTNQTSHAARETKLGYIGNFTGLRVYKPFNTVELSPVKLFKKFGPCCMQSTKWPSSVEPLDIACAIYPVIQPVLLNLKKRDASRSLRKHQLPNYR